MQTQVSTITWLCGLNGPRRWKAIKDSVISSHGAVVHFSDKSDNYYWAYKYVCKSDKDVLLSAGHENLNDIGSPKNQQVCKGLPW